jgi:glycosyltransferase involved in cell wall biosynthesis
VTVAGKLRVLVDGWSLIYQPNSPAAGHLLSLLTCQPDEAQVTLALPAEPPEWLVGRFSPLVQPTLNGIRQRIRWEQRSLPALAKGIRADLVHLSSATPSLFGGVPNLLSPADYGEALHHPGFYSRLRQALSAGGMVRLSGLVWPSDLPPPLIDTPVFRVTPALPFDRFVETRVDRQEIDRLRLPDSYILYHGPCHSVALRTLLESFGWAAGPVGENYPLLILGMDDVGRENLSELLAEYSLESCVRALPVISPYSVLRLYQNCSALFHPTEITPWGNPLRNAIACGKPVVAGETTLSDALVGPAAYLAALGHPRELGAALLTVIVEEGVANQLSAAALRHAAGWKTEVFRQELGEAYRILRDGGHVKG